MASEAVWGFDPDEVLRANQSLLAPPEEAPSELERERDRCARIPGSSDSQIYELRRMFRL